MGGGDREMGRGVGEEEGRVGRGEEMWGEGE